VGELEEGFLIDARKDMFVTRDEVVFLLESRG
jgi:hypothetical protein